MNYNGILFSVSIFRIAHSQFYFYIICIQRLSNCIGYKQNLLTETVALRAVSKFFNSLEK